MFTKESEEFSVGHAEVEQASFHNTVDNDVAVLIALIQSFKISTTPSEEAVLRKFLQKYPDSIQDFIQFSIGFCAYRMLSPVVLIQRYNDTVWHIIAETNRMLTLGMLNPYFLIEVPQHSAIAPIALASLQSIRQESKLNLDQVRRFGTQNGTAATEQTKIIPPEERLTRLRHNQVVSAVESLNDWVSTHQSILYARLKTLLTTMPVEQLESLVAQLEIKLPDAEDFVNNLGEVSEVRNEIPITYRADLIDKLYLIISALRSDTAKSAKIKEVLQLRDAHNSQVIIAAFLISLGINDQLCKQILGLNAVQYAELERQIVKTFLKEMGAEETRTTIPVVTLAREFTTYSEWNPYQDLAQSAFEFMRFQRYLATLEEKKELVVTALTPHELEAYFALYTRQVCMPEHRSPFRGAVELAKEFISNPSFSKVILFAMNMYDASETLTGFSNKMLKSRAQKYLTNVSTAGAVLSSLLKVETIATTDARFIDHGTLIWFGAALQKAQKEMKKQQS